MRLKNKVIIITGSCTGIGKAIAIRCVEEGAKVIITGLEKDLGEEVVEIVGSSNAVLHIEDITNEGSTQRLVQAAVKKFNRLDAVVNNAAWVTSSNIHTTEPEYFRKVLEINTIAPFNLIRAALPELKKTKGSVLNI
jgi:NAD(P)-dependent dehydrogenase (short-subunit alcohol dehydrogenase family)